MNDLTFPFLSVMDLVKTFDGRLVRALRGITLTIAKCRRFRLDTFSHSPRSCSKIDRAVRVVGDSKFPLPGKTRFETIACSCVVLRINGGLIMLSFSLKGVVLHSGEIILTLKIAPC